MKKSLILSAALCLASLFASAENAPTPRRQLAPKPPMGWMTWNLFQGNINEQLIRETADAMVEGGFRDAGYEYIFIDDLWQGGRDRENNIIPDPEKFPSGMKALADYVHSKGLKLGIYSDAAQLTCGGWTASLGFEEQDARTFASWGIDYLKYDYCNAPADSATARQRYRTMATALQNSGRDIVLGICEWGQRQCEEWCEEVGGQLWRTSGDVRDMWKDIVKQGYSGHHRHNGASGKTRPSGTMARHGHAGGRPVRNGRPVERPRWRRLYHDRISDADEHVVYAVVGACHDQRPAQGDRR